MKGTFGQDVPPAVDEVPQALWEAKAMAVPMSTPEGDGMMVHFELSAPDWLTPASLAAQLHELADQIERGVTARLSS